MACVRAPCAPRRAARRPRCAIRPAPARTHRLAAAAGDGTQEGEGEAPGGGGTPWRVAAALACAGCAETAYLTATKLFGGGEPAFCPTGAACEAVLSSPYASVYGLPL
eukprot:CAMPEP_0183818092 /NCGR_PEP_ID=MMETSP0803_2-20130417/61598_1 /TAXON_ID=195967 /ORGANISM="Crustomastix stigmata, Strain CCMP3273" /LENGTH=107 /DNA_ID=CAMNT_0026062979 /DNA_START=51 /DNA_END=371 /DNA_ORIENTATION=-